MYDADAGDLGAFVAEGWQGTTRVMPPMPPGDPQTGLARLLGVEQQLRTGTSPGSVDFGPGPYWADLGRMLGVYAVRNGPRETIERLRSQMDSDYYDIYIADRADALDQRRQG